MLPAKLQETRQTTSGNLPFAAVVAVEGAVAPAEAGVAVVVALALGSRRVLTHGEEGVSFVHMITVLSYKVLLHPSVRSIPKEKEEEKKP
jgi:hypothetical protein